jgi:hypothetical protein
MTEVKWQSKRSQKQKGFFDVILTKGFDSFEGNDGTLYHIGAAKFLRTLQHLPVCDFGMALLKDELNCGSNAMLTEGRVDLMSILIQCRSCKYKGDVILFDKDSATDHPQARLWEAEKSSVTNYAVDA